MPVPHKPEGYTSVAPYLIVDGASRTIGWDGVVVIGVRLGKHHFRHQFQVSGLRCQVSVPTALASFALMPDP